MRAIVLSIAVLALLGVFYAVVAAAGISSRLNAQTGRTSLVVATAGPSGLSTAASNIAAGDTVERTATLENRGTRAIQAIAMSASATQSSPLDRDARFGLRIRVDRCSNPWAARSPRSGLRCNGRATQLIAWRPLAAGSGSWRLGELAAGTTEWLRVSLQLPPDAPSRLADRPSIVMYRFTAE